jgi:hypothetical protein
MEPFTIRADQLRPGRHRWGATGEWLIVDAYTSEDHTTLYHRAGFTPADGFVAVISRLSGDPGCRDAAVWPHDRKITVEVIDDDWWRDDTISARRLRTVLLSAPELDPALLFDKPALYRAAMSHTAGAFTTATEDAVRHAAAMAGWTADQSEAQRLALRDAWWTAERARAMAGRRLAELAAYTRSQGRPRLAVLATVSEPERAALSAAGFGDLLPPRRPLPGGSDTDR